MLNVKSALIFVPLATVLAMALASGCTKKDTDGNLAVYHVSYPHKDDVKTWDPQNAYDQISLDLVPSVYETLYQYAYLQDTYTPEPLLAADRGDEHRPASEAQRRPHVQSPI